MMHWQRADAVRQGSACSEVAPHMQCGAHGHAWPLRLAARATPRDLIAFFIFWLRGVPQNLVCGSMVRHTVQFGGAGGVFVFYLYRKMFHLSRQAQVAYFILNMQFRDMASPGLHRPPRLPLAILATLQV